MATMRPEPVSGAPGPALDASSIPAFAEARPDMSADDIARELAAHASAAELRALAEAHIADTVDRARRERAREIEQQAYTDALPQTLAALRQADDDRRREAARKAAEEEQRCHQALFDDPLSYPGNQEQRRSFRRWAGDRFDEWYRRGRDAVEARGDDRAIAFFESDWHPEGPGAYFRARTKRKMWELVEHESERVRLKTTRELLETVFALGDGMRVTWGDATAAQHRQRIEMLTANASGIVETAARHRAAIRMLEDGGVTCLNELAEDAPAPDIATAA